MKRRRTERMERREMRRRKKAGKVLKASKRRVSKGTHTGSRYYKIKTK